MSVADGVAEKGQTYRTKQEMGSDYNMKDISGIGKEWNEQADFFAGYVKGMTGDEVSAIKTETNDAGAQVAADEDLYAGCTIGVTEMIQAVEKACKQVDGVENAEGNLEQSEVAVCSGNRRRFF